jgi:hypothetical protein
MEAEFFAEQMTEVVSTEGEVHEHVDAAATAAVDVSIPSFYLSLASEICNHSNECLYVC